LDADTVEGCFGGEAVMVVVRSGLLGISVVEEKSMSDMLDGWDGMGIYTRGTSIQSLIQYENSTMNTANRQENINIVNE
jgi:hypothetical protein